MPYVIYRESGEKGFVSNEAAADLVSGGAADLAAGETITVARDGKIAGQYDQEDFLNSHRFGAASDAAVTQLQQQRYLERKHDTLGQEVVTGLEGLARGATFGLSDTALVGLGVDADNIRNRQAVNSTIATGAELTGAIAPGLLSGGSGLSASIARALPSGAMAARTGALAGRLGGGLRGAVIAGGIEGSVFGAGQAVSRLALDDEPLTAEAAFAEIGTGVLLGGGLGVAGGALGVGLEKTADGMAHLGGKVKDVLVRRAAPALDATSKEGRALLQSIQRSADDLDEVIERAVAKAESRSTSGFRFHADDDVTEASFRALQKQKSEALDYANAAGGKLPQNVERAAAKAEQAEQKITALLSNKRGTVDFAKASSLDQKKLGSLSRAFDDFNGAMGKLADETGVPFAAAQSPVASGILPKIEGAGELAVAARDAHAAFRKQLGKDGIASIAEQTPEQAMATIKALQDATDQTAALARHVGGKEAEALSRIGADISNAIGGATKSKLPEVAELALALGIEEAVIPDVDGPADDLLKLYLASKMMGKMGGAGSLAEQALGKVASKLPGAKLHSVADGFVSDTLGKLATSTGKSLERVGKGLNRSLKAGARAAKRSSPAAASILGDVSFGESEGEKPRGAQAAFKLRSAELSAAVANMPATEERIAARLDGVSQVAPGVAEKIGAHARATIEFLHNKMPKDPGVLQKYGKSSWRPTEGELDKFARYVRAAKDPAGIIERFGDLRLSREDAEVLQTLYPAHFQRAQLWVMDNLERLAQNSTYRQRVQMSLFMGVPADPIMARAHVWQQNFQPVQEAQPQGPQKLGGANQEEPTAAQALQENRL